MPTNERELAARSADEMPEIEWGAGMDDQPHNEVLIDRFYNRVGRLPLEADPEPLLIEALSLIVAQAQARLGYIELRSPDRQDVRYARGCGCNDEDLDAIRRALSKGIVDYVITVGAAVFVDAMDDARFADLGSVRANEIHDVIVVPVGQPASGVIYLQAQVGKSFTQAVRERAENFARQLTPLVAQQLLGERRTLRVETRAFQRRHVLQVLERNKRNMSAAAADLGFSRQRLYEVLKDLGIERKP